jgi:2-polyprenyl-6-methoxyphenol hydroxylase-like FAD-dependent oxidoreductase
MHTTEVVVVGGGPTGMTVAGDLARAGHAVTVLERREEVNPSSRAFATQARTLEVLDSRGLAEGLLAKGTTTGAVRLWGGAALDLTRLPSRYPYGLITPQTNVDQALEGYALAHGAIVRRGVQVTGIEQDSDGVTVTTGSDSWRAAYVVGADGAHSTVRGLLGTDFPGRTVLRSVVLADVLLDNGPTGGGLTLGSTRDVFGFLAPYAQNGWYRSMTWDRRHQLPDDASVDPAEVGDVLNRAMGHDVGVTEISWKSRFHCEERQVADYRTGRTFLAGDAAHVHSPMGGQGMNTGIQDAVNLAWKLALALEGADASILDTYQTERHPIGRRVVRQSGAMMRAITLKPRPARLLRNLVAPRLLRISRVSDAIAGGFAGVTLRYPSGKGQHALVGTRATEVPLAGDRLTVLQREPGFVLVRAHGTPAAPTGLTQAERTDDGPALLVRPDGYVAWAGTDAGWREALAAWTGTAEQPVNER